MKSLTKIIIRPAAIVVVASLLFLPLLAGEARADGSCQPEGTDICTTDADCSGDTVLKATVQQATPVLKAYIGLTITGVFDEKTSPPTLVAIPTGNGADAAPLPSANPSLLLARAKTAALNALLPPADASSGVTCTNPSGGTCSGTCGSASAPEMPALLTPLFAVLLGGMAFAMRRRMMAGVTL